METKVEITDEVANGVNALLAAGDISGRYKGNDNSGKPKTEYLKKMALMTDKELQKLMDDTYKACIHHKKLLYKLEQEYKKRFGYDPSSVDDDYFIDTFHYGSGGRITINQMTKNAQRYS